MAEMRVDDFFEHSVFEHVADMKKLAEPLKCLGINFFAKVCLKHQNQTQYLITSECMASHCAELGVEAFKFDVFLTPLLAKPDWYLLEPYMSLPMGGGLRDILRVGNVEVGVLYITYEDNAKVGYLFGSNSPSKFYQLFFEKYQLLLLFLSYAKKELKRLQAQSNHFVIGQDIWQGLAENYSLDKMENLKIEEDNFFNDINQLANQLDTFIACYKLNKLEADCCYYLSKGLSAHKIAKLIERNLWQTQELIDLLRKKTYFRTTEELKLKLRLIRT